MSTKEESTRALIKHKDLSVTALYTAHTWAWAGFPYAHFFANQQTHGIFNVTHLFIWIAHIFRKKPVSLPHSLVQRHRLIDQLVYDSEYIQVVELASGLSARSLRFTQMLADVDLQESCWDQLHELVQEEKNSYIQHPLNQQRIYFEVDLEHVINHKKKCFEQLQDHLHMQGQDLIQVDQIIWQVSDLKYDDLSWVPLRKTLMIAEGLCMYLQAEEQRNLWKRIYQCLSHVGGGTFVFDLVPSCEQDQGGIFGKALESLMRLFTGGQSFTKDMRTRDTIVQELIDIGFDDVHYVDPNVEDTHRQYQIPQFTCRTQQLIFIMHVRS